MEKADFLSALAVPMENASPRELAEVQTELGDHIADHAADLEAAGWSEADAEAAAVAAMGDPAEVGEALNREFSRFWGAVSRWAAVALILLIVAAFIPVCYSCIYAAQSLAWRIDPQKPMARYFKGLDAVPLDIRMDGADGDVVRFAMEAMTTETLPDENGAEQEWDVAVIGVCIYDRNPFRYVADSYTAAQPSFLTDVPHTHGVRYSGGGVAVPAAAIQIYHVPVHRGQATVTAQYDLFGTYFTVEVPLYWGDGHEA